MKRLICNILSKLLAKKNIKIISTPTLNLAAEYPRQIIRQYEKQPAFERKIDSIIFSKDRAIQLHAFIESYYQKVEGAGTLYVLYKATGKHVGSYEDLKKIWSDNDVVFVEENKFREQLNNICDRSTAQLIGFYVDDMVFTQKVSYDKILEYDPLEYVVCLNRGCDFNYSQVCQKPCQMPKLTNKGDGFYEFRWDEDIEYSDWKYRMGVSSYFYSRIEIGAIFNLIDYKTPNSLEVAMQQFLLQFRHRKGLCMDKVACVCVPINLVQEECENPITGHISVDELLDKWSEGLKIDISKFDGVGLQGVFMNYDYINR